MKTSVEFYEGLRKHIPDEAAKMIAEAFPVAQQVATKSDVAALKVDFLEVESRLQKQISDGFVETHRWLLAFVATQWLGVAGILVAIFLKH